MFQNKIDELRNGAGTVMRVASLAVGIALAASVTLCFLCAAAFVYILDRYGLIEACLAGAGVFFIATIVLVMSYLVVKRRRQQPKEAEKPKSQAQTMLLDPMVVAAGIQIIRAVGIKRLVPILAIGGVVLGLMARPSPRDADDNG
jgi:hypothetical protein